MLNVNVEKVEKAISEVAEEIIVPRFCTLSEGDIAFKIGDDPVTIADKEAEKELSRRLLDLLPGSNVLGEEAFAENPSISDLFLDDSPLWIIDPIDGTKAFVAGKPFYGVIVALAKQNQTVAGWLYDPTSREFVTAEKGAGAYHKGKKLVTPKPTQPPSLRGAKRRSNPVPQNQSETLVERLGLDCHAPLRGARNDDGGQAWELQKLSVLPPTQDVEDMRGVLGRAIVKELKANGISVTPDGQPAILSGAWSACHDFARLVAGNGHFSRQFEQMHFYAWRASSTPWDCAAGLLIHAEAGGYAAMWDGKELLPSHFGRGFLAAPDRPSWEKIKIWAEKGCRVFE